MASSGPMIASTFWKKTIPLCTGWDQSTACSSSWWSAKLPAVWKNFFGTIGARSRTSASGRRSPVSATWPPRSKYSRVEAQSSSTTTSPSRRPTRPASKVTSFMLAARSRSVKVAFAYHPAGTDAVSSKRGTRGGAPHVAGRGAPCRGAGRRMSERPQVGVGQQAGDLGAGGQHVGPQLADDPLGGPVPGRDGDVDAGQHAAVRAGDRAGHRPEPVGQLLVLHGPALVADGAELIAQLGEGYLRVGP